MTTAVLPPPPKDPGDIRPIGIEDEMRRSYLDYAMSVIVSRALPDVRDGLKPVHRRILYAMGEKGYDWNRAYVKCARIVGDVMGTYHPHGDAPIYEALVRMAQDFSMRARLVDGQGNFGSMDGDPPAAMRYTEARLAKLASTALLQDIDKSTVDFQANYDDTTKEPRVLPARFPNLLVNGAQGIAVGMATNIPTHNLGEVIDACCAYLDNPGITVEELLPIMPGPDFPTGASILGRAGIYEAYKTGRGTIVMRAKTAIEETRKDREAIIITEVPYQVNKARLLERIAELVQDKVIEGIAESRDESDRDGLRVVIELKRDAASEVVLNQLYKHTQLQTNFSVNMLAIDAGRPQVMPVKDVIAAFCAFREEVVRKRTGHELEQARARAHVLAGLALAVANLDRMIALIRGAKDPDAARAQMLAIDWPAGDVAPLITLIDEPGHRIAADGTYKLSEIQARAILELRLQRLTGLERDKIAEELDGLVKQIGEYVAILESREKRIAIVRAELLEVRAEFATPRRTMIEESEIEVDIEDLIAREDMVVTVTLGGYIKRQPLSAYRLQNRGGKGRAAMGTKDEDVLTQVYVVNTHTPVLFFSSRGMVYKLKVFRLPLGNPQSRGKAMVNLLPLQAGETITTVMPMPEDEASWAQLHVMFATQGGTIRRNALSDFVSVMANGKIAMKLEDEEGKSVGRLIGVQTCREDQDVLIATRDGKAIRFAVVDVRVFSGRSSVGVRAIRLAEGDEVISLSILDGVAADTIEREAYIRMAAAKRRAAAGETGAGEAGAEEAAPAEEGDAGPTVTLDAARFAALEEREQFVLTVTDKGFGKRTSAYEYRATGRGGQGIAGIELSDKNGKVVGSFPVRATDQLMLVTDKGQIIRCPVGQVRIAGRRTQGVLLFRVAAEERVVSVARMGEAVAAEDEAGGGEAGGGEAGGGEAGGGEGTGDDGPPQEGIFPPGPGAAPGQG